MPHLLVRGQMIRVLRLYSPFSKTLAIIVLVQKRCAIKAGRYKSPHFDIIPFLVSHFKN